MASVIIKEEDYTRSEAYSPTDTIVYIPGMIGADDGIPHTSAPTEPTLFETVEEFVEKIGKEPLKISEKPEEGEEEVEYDKSYVMAKQLLAVGMKVLYRAVNDVTTRTDMINWLKNSENWKDLYDRSLYNIRFITSGGYSAIQSLAADNNSNPEPIATNMIDCAYYHAENKTGRGDCVALIDHPINATLDQVKDIFGENSFARNLTTSGSFGAAFTPWCKFALSIDLNGIQDPGYKEYWALPGSFAYLLAYNTMLGTNPTWYAAAGLQRGVIPLIKNPLLTIGDLVSKDFQTRENGAVAVNPIINIPGYGYRIWGNRTLLPNGKDGLKASSFLNIRNLCSDIKKTSYQACKFVTFEQNTDVMWANLKAQITPLLDKMASGEGINGYKITRVPTNKKATVIGNIKIIPIEAVEDFELTIQLVDSLETEIEG